MADQSSERRRWPAGDGANPEFRYHHALLVGISEYHHRHRVDRECGGRLPGAGSDARRLEEVLHQIGYARSHVKCLCDHDATRKTVRSTLLEMRDIEPAELVIIFWAGHGVQANGSTRLLPYDADPHQLELTTLSINDIASLVNVLDTANLAIIVDTCYARPRPSSFLHPDWHAVPRLLADRVALFAGASTYLALEAPEQGGILKSCLEEALTGTDASLCDRRGLVRLEAAAAYLQRHVEERADRVWRAARRASEGATGGLDKSPQSPFFVLRPGRLPPVGCNLGAHVRWRLSQEALPRPMADLAVRVFGHGGLLGRSP